MKDLFQSQASSLESPAAYLEAVTPNDAVDLPHASRGINVSTSGTVRATTVGGTTETVFVAAGGAFPLRATRIWQTGTTATDVVAMY